MAKEPTDDAILRAVGAALHNWSLVELALASAFGKLLGLTMHSQRIFGTIISFDTRVAICDQIAAANVADELDREIWAKISARLLKLYKKRHEVAHFTLGRRGSEPIIRPFLTLNKITETVPGLDLRQINERSAKFGALMKALDWYGDYVVLRRIGNQPTRLAALQEPPLVAQLRELATRSLAERKERERTRKPHQ